MHVNRGAGDHEYLLEGAVPLTSSKRDPCRSFSVCRGRESWARIRIGAGLSRKVAAFRGALSQGASEAGMCRQGRSWNLPAVAFSVFS
jgi:hypothetical protein